MFLFLHQTETLISFPIISFSGIKLSPHLLSSHVHHPTMHGGFHLLFTLTFILPLLAIADEPSALLAFRSYLIDPLDVLRDWKSPTAADNSTSHCSWTGIGCNSVGSVDTINLSQLNLSGIITPESLLHLPSLTTLNLCCNSFSSTLPPNIWNWTLGLRELDISDNSFYGNFPSGLGLLPSLKLLNASGNNFEGPLPVDLANATSLETLDLRGGFFTGNIPLSYKNLLKLKFLGLSGNNLTGKLPPELGQLASLETLIIGYNELDGTIPVEFGRLHNLRYLDMAVGNLAGPIPAELGFLPHLNTVYLYKNNIDGEIPRELGNASALAFLDLSDNAITGAIPDDLSRLSNLQLLNLMCNKISGPVPVGIGELPKLEELELWNNSLTGPLPTSLGRNSPLQRLDVSSNSLSGEIPAGLCDSGNLTKLILFSNAFTGRVPAGLTACSSLVRVRMHNNRLNGTIPAGLGWLPSLQRLELAGNELTGEIPADLSASLSLSFIDISHNRLQLSLPPNILSIPTLQTFMATDNELTGGIPDDLQDCPSLAAVDLSSNRLTGGIPRSLASCERLVSLSLRGNRLTGSIPTAISMMPTLSVLDLSNNLLTGTVPSSFGSSPALETLNLSYNNLSGQLPGNGLLSTINPDDLAGNPNLCGGVLSPCSSKSLLSGWPKGPHIKHVAAGWVVGISTVVIIGIVILGAQRLYMRKYVDGCCRVNENGGAWPWQLTAFQRLSFTSTDLLACVKESNIIGMGGSGVVYKAELNRQTVAVKKLWRAGTAEGEFAGEASILGRLRHRNIVRMLGYLHNDIDMMIVYEYIVNGSLWEALHGVGKGGGLVDWVARYNVAVGVAQGLAYLHHDCRPPIVHRDVKSSNILLDGNFEARVADFGLAKMLVKKDETISMVAGSYGYIAPEYGYTLKVDEKSDIYSFGVVLMELLTGKRPIEPEFADCQDIVGWVRERLRGSRGPEALDGSIGGQCKHVQEEMMLVLRVAVLCTASSPKDRPSMRDVLTMLGEAKPRRKSSVAANVGKEKPVFSTSPDSDYF